MEINGYLAPRSFTEKPAKGMDLTALTGGNGGEDISALHGIKSDSSPVSKKHNIIHIRIKKEKRKSITSIEGIDQRYDFQKILSEFMKDSATSGNVVVDDNGMKIINVHGDQRQNAATWLVKQKITKPSRIQIHGWS